MRRALSDPAVESDRKAALVESVFGSQIGPAALGIIANLADELFVVTACFFACLGALESNILGTSSVQCAKRGGLQMNCLSSEDLKEERDCSLTFNPTLNLHACPAVRQLFQNPDLTH